MAVSNANKNGGRHDKVAAVLGDRLASASVRPTYTAYRVVARTYTNRTNTRTRVAELRVRYFFVPSPFFIQNRSYYFGSLNYDLGAGGFIPLRQGRINDSIPAFAKLVSMDTWFGNTVNFHDNQGFCHVPLFSSLASNRRIVRQTDLYRSADEMIGTGELPFDQVYLGTRDSEHGNVRSRDLSVQQWFRLIDDHFPAPSCNATRNAVAPTRPTVGRSGYRRGCPGERVVLYATDDLLQDGHTYRWTVTGPQNFTAFGQRVGYNLPYTPGRYTARVTKSYSAASGAAPVASSNTVTLLVRDEDDSQCAGAPNGPGGPARRSSLDNAPVITPADSTGLELWPNPTSGPTFLRFTADASENTELVLTDALGRVALRRAFGGHDVVAGSNEVFLDVGSVSAGLYTVTLTRGEILTRSQLLVTP